MSVSHLREAELREAAGHLYEAIQTAGAEHRVLPWHIHRRYRGLVAALTQRMSELHDDPTAHAAFAPDRSSAWTELQFEPDSVPHFAVMYESSDDADLASDQLANLDLARGNLSPSFDADHDDREQLMRAATYIRAVRKEMWAQYKDGLIGRPDWELLTSQAVAYELQARGVSGADGKPIDPQQIRAWVKSTPKVTLSDKRRKDAERRGVAYVDQAGSDAVLVYPRDPDQLIAEAEARGYEQPPARSSLFNYSQTIYADNHDRRRWALAAFADEFHFGDTVAAMGVLDSGDRYGSPPDQLLPRNGQLWFESDDRDPMAIGIAADQHQRLEQQRILAAVHGIGLRKLSEWKLGLRDMAVHPVIANWITRAHQVLKDAEAESERRALQARAIKEAAAAGVEWEPDWTDRRVRIPVPAGAPLRDHMNYLHRFAAGHQHRGSEHREMPRDHDPIIPEKVETPPQSMALSYPQVGDEHYEAKQRFAFWIAGRAWVAALKYDSTIPLTFSDLGFGTPEPVTAATSEWPWLSYLPHWQLDWQPPEKA